jgi:hypothetical protein
VLPPTVCPLERAEYLTLAHGESLDTSELWSNRL